MSADTSNEQLQGPPGGAPRGRLVARLLGLLSDTVTYGLSSVIAQVVQFFLLPLYTHYLAPEENGIIAMLVIVALLFGPLANLGMTNAVFRRLNQATDAASGRAVLSTALVSVIFASGILLAILLGFAPWIAADFVGDAHTTNLVRLCLLSATLNTIAQVPNMTLRARREVKTVAVLNLASVVISIGTTVLFVVGLGMGVQGWVFGMLAGDLALMILSFVATRGMFDLRFNRAVWRSMISYGLPLVPHRMQAIALVQFSQFIVRSRLGLFDAGIYAIAVKFALPVGVVVNAIQEAWIPFKFQMHAQEHDSQHLFRSIFTYYFATVSYLWVGVSLWGFDTVRLMTAPDYHAAAFLVPALALLRVSQGVYFMMGTGLELSDRTGAFPLVSLSGLVTVVAASFLLIDPMGALGAALASVLCWLVMTVIVYQLAQRRFEIAYDWPSIGCLALLAAACVGAGYAVQSATLWTRIAVYTGISLMYPLAAVLLLARSPSERRRVRLLLVKLRGWRRLNPSA
jgi:O-antigen/teichoic acid export membrane protein